MIRGMQLVPCLACNRHVAVDATACPFCGASRIPTSPRCGVHAGKLSRAAVFAGLTACVPPASPQPITQAPAPVKQTQAAQSPQQSRQIAQPPPAFDDRNASYPDPRRAPEPKPDRASVVARFTDRKNQLMRGLRVRLDGPESRTALSDAEGVVIIENVLPGKYKLTVEGIPGPDYLPLVAELDLVAGRVQPMAMLGEHMTKAEAMPKPIDKDACCKPYGAPPARRRVV
jgi:hypothetical protein